MRVKIYCLIDPITNQARYVGQTVFHLKRRLCGHLNGGGSIGRNKWVAVLKSNGLKPSIELLEEVNRGDCVEAERFWISYLRWLGADLLNVGGGGEQIYVRGSRLMESATATMEGPADSASYHVSVRTKTGGLYIVSRDTSSSVMFDLVLRLKDELKDIKEDLRRVDGMLCHAEDIACRGPRYDGATKTWKCQPPEKSMWAAA